jgi:amino acid transporter
MSEPSSLPRVIGYTTATAIVVGTVIGSGVFRKAKAVADTTPEFSLAILAWVLVGLLALLGALALAEVAVIVGKVGGNYAILRDAYGRRAGFLWGWVEFWIIRSGSIAALATVFTDSLHDILRQVHSDGAGGDVLTHWQRVAATLIVIAVLGVVNALGTKLGGGLQVAVTLVKVLSLLAIALSPLIALALLTSPEARPQAARLEPVWPSGWGLGKLVAFGGSLVGVFWAYHGWMNIAPVAEEIRNPQRNIPLALLSGILILIALYVSVNLAYYLAIPSAEIRQLGSRPVAAEYGYRLLGPVGLLLASTAIMISVFGSLNGNLLVGARLPFAMARDRLAPAGLAKLHPVFNAPSRAVGVLAGWSVLLVLAVGFLQVYRVLEFHLGEYTLDLNLPKDKPAFDVITDFAMFGAISFETLAVSSIFVFRRRFPPSTVPLPYRCPLYPFLPALYVTALAAVLFNMFWSQRPEAITGVVFIVIGAGVYEIVRRREGNA